MLIARICRKLQKNRSRSY